jgi:hypothetical protein
MVDLLVKIACFVKKCIKNSLSELTSTRRPIVPSVRITRLDFLERPDSNMQCSLIGPFVNYEGNEML